MVPGNAGGADSQTITHKKFGTREYGTHPMFYDLTRTCLDMFTLKRV